MNVLRLVLTEREKTHGEETTRRILVVYPGVTRRGTRGNSTGSDTLGGKESIRRGGRNVRRRCAVSVEGKNERGDKQAVFK